MGAARIVAEELAAALGREIIGFEPVLANQHRIERTATDIRDEAREVPRNLRIGRTISGLGLGDSASLAQPIDLDDIRSEEHTSELQSLMRISYAVFCLKKKKNRRNQTHTTNKNTTE